MKKLSFALLLLAATICTHAQKWNYQFDHTITKVKGHIQMMDNGQLAVIVPEDNPNQRYIANNLPDDFKKEGLHVTFGGDVGKIPPNVRMMGTPLYLKSICVSGSDKKKFNLKKKKYSFKKA